MVWGSPLDTQRGSWYNILWLFLLSFFFIIGGRSQSHQAAVTVWLAVMIRSGIPTACATKPTKSAPSLQVCISSSRPLATKLLTKVVLMTRAVGVARALTRHAHLRTLVGHLGGMFSAAGRFCGASERRTGRTKVMLLL